MSLRGVVFTTKQSPTQTIDTLVYQLYNLTPEEIAIVEAS
jgi:hypothetical protein